MDFPDSVSGTALQMPVPLGVEAFIRIDSITLQTDMGAQAYSPETVRMFTR